MFGISPSRLIADRRAVTTIEYAIIASIMVAACIGSVTVIGQKIEAFFAAALAAFP
jgi:Flp pilus assembly pilin Flp